ncbi:FAD-binding oxidoreductase [Tsuneonella sp. HG222]
MRNPNGVSPSDFRAALDAFAAVVGKEWVFSTEADLELYRDDYSPVKGKPEERLASAAVAPESTEQVQSIVRIANKYKIPLYPISTGKNLGYGGAAPVMTGSVVLDLKRMNRVLAIDEARCFALVEPGVSYFDLYHHIQEKGLKLWIDCPDPGWGSLVGNALDRGIGYTMPNVRNHWEAHCGMEVVLANGDVMRTGMGAMPEADSWQEYRSGYGPIVDGLFSQSNFGIVTKMGFWLMPEPEGYRTATIEVPRYQDLHELVRIFNFVENSRLFTGMPYLASPLLNVSNLPEDLGMETRDRPPISPTPEHQALIRSAAVGYSDELERYGIANQIPYWSLRLGFYGPLDVTAAQWEAIKRRFGQIPGVRFQDGKAVPLPVSAELHDDVHHAELGIPSLEIFQLIVRRSFNPAGSEGHIGFSPVIPRTAQAIFDLNRELGPVLSQMQSGWSQGFILPHLYWERSFVCVIGLLLSTEAKNNEQIIDLYKQLVAKAAENGWGEYRTPIMFQDLVARTYSFGDHALLKFQEKLKDATDPNGILSPGRYGIWPASLRAAKDL